MKRLLYVFIIILLASCGEYNDTGNSKGDGLTTVGNPNPTIPLPTTTSFKANVKDLLKKDFEWEVSLPGEGPLEDIYVARFDVEKENVHIKIVGSTEEYKVDLKIEDDGTVTAEDKDSSFKISGKYNPDGNSLQLFVELNDESSEVFAVDIPNDTFFEGLSDPTSLCKGSDEKFFWATSGILGNKQRHIAGSSQFRDEAGNECRQKINNFCAIDGELLANIIPYEGDPLDLGYAIEYVECTCHNRKCIGEVSEKEYNSWISFVNVCSNPSSACSFTYDLPPMSGFDGPSSDMIDTMGEVHDFLAGQK